GDYRGWRATIPGEGARIIGGTASMTIASPTAGMAGRLLLGGGTAASLTLYDGQGDGSVVRTVSGAHDWIQFDLRATRSVRTSSSGQNRVTLGALQLQLRDTVPPIFNIYGQPAPTTWHGASTCAGFALGLGDQGGGLAQARMTRVDTGAVVAAWD